MDGTRLIVAGTAPTSWIRESRSLARLLPGLDHYDDQPVMSQSLDEAARQLTETSILFEQGAETFVHRNSDTASPAPWTSFTGLTSWPACPATLTIRIIGRTDIVGGAAQNRRLSEGRAHSVLAAIHPEAHPSITFEAHGVTRCHLKLKGARDAAALSEDRRVSFSGDCAPGTVRTSCHDREEDLHVGAFAVGKTSLVRRFVTSCFFRTVSNHHRRHGRQEIADGG